MVEVWVAPWSRSKKRTRWYQWILRSLLLLGIILLALLEPLLTLVDAGLGDGRIQRRALLLLSVVDHGFVACFLIELYYTRRLLFFVELGCLAVAFASSSVLAFRLFLYPGIALDAAAPRQRRFAAVLVGLATLDSELLPLLPWRETRSRRDKATGRLAKKHYALKHLAGGFPTVAASRASLGLDALKHSATAIWCISNIVDGPDAGCIIEFATLTISLTSVLFAAYNRVLLLRRGRESDDDAQPARDHAFTVSSPVSFTPNPLTPPAPGADGGATFPPADVELLRTSRARTRASAWPETKNGSC